MSIFDIVPDPFELKPLEEEEEEESILEPVQFELPEVEVEAPALEEDIAPETSVIDFDTSELPESFEEDFGSIFGDGTLATGEDSPPFSLDVLRRDVTGGFFSTIGEGVKGSAIKRVARKVEYMRDPGRYDPMLEFMMEGGQLPKEDTDKILKQSLRTGADVADLLDKKVYKIGESISNFAEEFFPTDQRYNDTIQRKLGQGGGSLIAFLASALGTPVLTAVFGGNVNVSAQFMDAINEGASFEKALKTADLAFAFGLSEAIPILGFIKRMDKGTGGLFGKTLTTIMRKKFGDLGKVATTATGGAIEEALQESLLFIANNYDAKDISGYDPDRDVFKGSGEQAAIGGTLGWMVNALGSILGITRRNVRAGALKRLRKQRDSGGTPLDQLVKPKLQEDVAAPQQTTLALQRSLAEPVVPPSAGKTADVAELGPVEQLPVVEGELGQAADVINLDDRRPIPEPPQATELNAAQLVREQEASFERGANREIDALEEAGQDVTVLQEQRDADIAAEEGVPTPETGTLTLLEGGAQPPLDLPPSGPVSSDGSTPPPAVNQERMSLRTVAESRPLVGNPTAVVIDDNKAGASIDGRSFKNDGRDSRKEMQKVRKSLRLWVDIALTTSLFKGRSDTRMMKDILLSVAPIGRAMAKHAETRMNKINNQYRVATGKKLEDAPQEHLKLFTRFGKDQISRKEVKELTGATDQFLDSITAATKSIAEISKAMVDGEMIAADLSLTFEANTGAYISVSYAANVLNRNNTTNDILALIPEEVQNRWIHSFINTYITPITNTNLADTNLRSLRRQAKALRLVERRSVPDPKGEPRARKDILVLRGDKTFTPFEESTEESLRDTISEHGGLDKDEVTNIMLTALNSVVDGGGGGGISRDRSIERRLLLARPPEVLAAKGFSKQEIAHHQATRDLLMETVNPATNVGITLNKMMGTILSHRVVNDIASLHSITDPNPMVSLGKPDKENNLTELLIPRGHALSDIRVPDPNNPGKMIFASPQHDAAGKNDGIYVSPRMARMFQHMTKASKGGEPFINFLRSMAGLTKVNLTALNLSSHPRNMGTAALLLNLRGHAVTRPGKLLDQFSTVMGVAARDLGNKNLSPSQRKAYAQDSMDVILEYFVSLNLFHNSVRTGPVRELLTKVLEARDVELLGNNTYLDANYLPVEGVLSSLAEKGATKVGRLAAQIGSKPMALFRLEDEVVKALAFMVERRRYAILTDQLDIVDMIDGKAPATDSNLAKLREFDTSIAKYITDLYPTYSKVPVGLRALSRNLVVTPFPSFTAEMWRNNFNDYVDLMHLKRGTGRYKDVPNTRRMELLGTRVIVKLAYHTAVSGIISSAAMLGLSTTAVGLDPTDDEFDVAFRESMAVLGGKKLNSMAIDMPTRVIAPTYMKDSVFQIISFEPGESITLRNLTFTLPNSQQLEVGFGMANTIELMIVDGDIDRAMTRLLSTTVKFASDYIKEDVLASTVLEAQDGRTMSGMPIWDDGDEFWERQLKKAQYIGTVLIPGSRLVREGDRFAQAVKDDDVLAEIIRFAFGVKDTNYRLDTLLSGTLRVLQDDPSGIKWSTTDINRLLSSNEEMSDEVFIDKYLDLEEQRREAFKELRLAIRAAESMGMTKRNIQRTIDGNKGLVNPGGMTVRDVLKDNYIVYSPDGDNVISMFRAKRSGKLTVQERKAELRLNKPIIRHRLRLIRRYRRRIEIGDFTR